MTTTTGLTNSKFDYGYADHHDEEGDKYVGADEIRSRRHHITNFKNSMLCACDNIEQRNLLVGLLSRRTSLGPTEILFVKACLEECMSLVGAVKQIRRTG